MRMHYLINANKFFFEEKIAEKGYLEVIDGVIGNFYKTLPDKINCEICDFSNFSIAPGLVDTHIHGYAGHDFMDLDEVGILEICRQLPSTGVTSFLPTLLSDSIAKIETSCRVIADNALRLTGAKIQGIYLEGPFLLKNIKACRIQNFLDPAPSIFNQWQSAANGLIKNCDSAGEKWCN